MIELQNTNLDAVWHPESFNLEGSQIERVPTEGKTVQSVHVLTVDDLFNESLD